MAIEDLKNRVRVLLKKVKRDEKREIDVYIVNRHIEDIEELKEDLLEDGFDWIENLEELESFDEDGFDDFEEDEGDEDEVMEAFEELERQIDKIATKFGIDMEDGSEGNGINITVNPSFHQSQSQSQHQIQNIEIETLKEDLEKELSKDYPDESKVRKIIKNIIEVGEGAASGIISAAILSVLG